MAIVEESERRADLALHGKDSLDEAFGRVVAQINTRLSEIEESVNQIAKVCRLEANI